MFESQSIELPGDESQPDGKGGTIANPLWAMKLALHPEMTTHAVNEDAAKAKYFNHFGIIKTEHTLKIARLSE